MGSKLTVQLAHILPDVSSGVVLNYLIDLVTAAHNKVSVTKKCLDFFKLIMTDSVRSLSTQTDLLPYLIS